MSAQWGRAAHASNYLQEQLGQLFALVTAGPFEIALAVWYSVPNDSTQRSMLRGALNASVDDRWAPRLPSVKSDVVTSRTLRSSSQDSIVPQAASGRLTPLRMPPHDVVELVSSSR